LRSSRRRSSRILRPWQSMQRFAADVMPAFLQDGWTCHQSAGSRRESCATDAACVWAHARAQTRITRRTTSDECYCDVFVTLFQLPVDEPTLSVTAPTSMLNCSNSESVAAPVLVVVNEDSATSLQSNVSATLPSLP
jgi:hypothetical protein